MNSTSLASPAVEIEKAASTQVRSLPLEVPGRSANSHGLSVNGSYIHRHSLIIFIQTILGVKVMIILIVAVPNSAMVGSHILAFGIRSMRSE